MQRFFLLIPLIIFAFSLNAQVSSIKGAEKISAVLTIRSAPLRDLPTANQNFTDNQLIRTNESLDQKNIGVLKNYPYSYSPDLGLQRVAGDTSTVIDSISIWQGLNSNVDPSDNTLAVSANYVVQMTNNISNSIMNVWDKSGNLLVNKINTEDISGLGDYGDPNIIYDRRADRFVFCALDAYSYSKLVVCISETGDPSGTWLGYLLSFANGFPDYPKIAVWGDGYYITTNSNEPTIWALKRDELLSGVAVGNAQKFELDRLGTIGFQSASPVTETGINPPPENAPAMFMRVADDAWFGIDSDHLEIFFVSINWEDETLSELTNSFNISTIPYDSKMCGFDSWECIPQPASAVKLDPLSDIVMDKVQYLNFQDHETIVCSHVCRAYTAGYAGIRWYELRKYPTQEWEIYQQGTFAPDDSNYRFMPSISMNDLGTIALGYNISSPKVFPGIRITGRTACDSLNIMTAPEFNAVEGTGANSYNRYGDYNNMVADPFDGSFWFTSNYNPSSSWKTKIVHFNIDSCDLKSTETPVLENSIVIGPNPVSDQLNLTLNSDITENIEVKIFDILGQLIYRETIYVDEGINTTVLDFQLIANGTYFLNVIINGKEQSEKIIVQHN